ncbi:Site-specific recombinase XerD [Flexibacter flexilis DSM 6793]|uniref:Site-specific recombinase XerD n=1 Tax=Flexibacter flexilis DSM 6793 TaxID=927664 RepID=A0A1I1M3X3_9BACT|nr:tyrosine-type recombinase/integrase [Flexibacter flexilis]SFC80187.1 Site-specific recombinase XerD [Flexibacter flexilis DSM 6793]
MTIYTFHRLEQKNKKGEAPIYAYVILDGEKSGNFALGLVAKPELLGQMQSQINLAKQAITDIHTFLSMSQKSVAANDIKDEYIRRKRGNTIKIVEVNKPAAASQTPSEDICFFDVARRMGKPHFYIQWFEKYAKQHPEFSTKISEIRPLIDNYLSVFQQKNTGTAKVYFGRIKQVILFAIDEGLIVKNPLRGIVVKAKKREKLTYLTQEDLEKIENYAFAPKIKPYAEIFLFACQTGLSLSDCATITQANVVAYGERLYIVARRKKSSSVIRTHLSAKAHGLWQKYQYNFSQYFDAFDAKLYKKQHNLRIQVLMKIIREITGVKKVTFHKARATKAFELLNRGATIDTVSATLGHANTVITQQYYAELSLQTLDNALDKLDN